MCKLHENLGFVAEKLYQLKLIETANLEILLEHLCCNSSEKNCMYGDCKDKSVPIESAYASAAKVYHTLSGSQKIRRWIRRRRENKSQL